MGLIFESVGRELVALFLFLIAIIYINFRISFNYWKKKSVPYLHPSFPLGNVSYNAHDKLIPILDEIYYKFKNSGEHFGGIYILKYPVFVPVHPDINKYILVKDYGHFADRGGCYDEKLDPITANLASVRGEKWHFLRSSLNPAFSSSKMKLLTSGVVLCAENIPPILEKSARKSEPIHVNDISSRFTMDVIGSCMFGVNSNCLENPDAEFRKCALQIFDTSPVQFIRTLYGILLPGVLRLFRIRMFNPKATEFIRRVANDSIQFREKHGIEKNDFMDMLIKLKNNQSIDDAKKIEPGRSLTMDDIVAQLFIFYLAGYDTSSNVISFCLYELAMNPDIQDALRSEIHKVLSKYNGDLTYDAIWEMSYLDKVVNETLRKHSPVVMLNRRCSKTYKIPDTDVIIDEDTPVVVPVYAIHHDHEYYPNPELFDPERFSEEAVKTRPKYTYFPFGTGPRSCIANRFGLLETKIAVITFLRRFSYTLNEKTKTPLEVTAKATMLRTRNKIWLNVKKI